MWRVDDDRVLVVTTDFFTPVVDTARQYGAISAANSLSDIYAMGAIPLFAMNILAIPPSLPAAIIQEILLGGAEKVREAGAVLAGGHSVQDDEPKYGLVAVGMADSNALMTKTAAEPGNVLVLSKPIGTGTTTTALKNDRVEPKDIEQAIEWMELLNRGAADLAKKCRVRAATDITGFSLLGHAHEMASGSQVALNIHLGSVPFLRNAKQYVATGNIPGGSADNKLYYEKFVEFDDDVDPVDELLLFDAQTSGGLLMAVPEESVGDMIADAEREDLAIWPIGNVEQGVGIRVRSSRFPVSPSIDSIDLDLWHSDRG